MGKLASSVARSAPDTVLPDKGGAATVHYLRTAGLGQLENAARCYKGPVRENCGAAITNP